jgi:hypothetical protein
VDSSSYQYGLSNSNDFSLWSSGEIFEGVRKELLHDEQMGAIPVQGWGVPAENLNEMQCKGGDA